MVQPFDLTLVWAAIISFSIIMYVLMDGFDLGQGILFPFAPTEYQRDVMMNSVAPVWDGNETWLVLGGTGLLAAFPVVYSVFLPALYIGVFMLLVGLIFRGVAFEFRFKAKKSRYLWNWAFAGGSFLASFAQGAVVGAYIQGFKTENFRYVGGALDWFTPFTVITGIGLVSGYALLGATWLIMKSEGEVQNWAYKVAPRLLVLVLAVFMVICAYTPFIDDSVMVRWFDRISIIWIFPVLVLYCAWVVFQSLRKRKEGLPFVATMGLFLFTYIGLLTSKWPYIVPPNYTLWDAASSYESQLFLLLGFLFVIPIILTYTAWTYWVFRGKVKQGGYH
ncbi:cytochrome d ubiquinol oxidase subunit II [Aeromonas salmonicida]|uniref:cytochrome d ubiquinol oxidase subunit II n=1 Tax=Aeromonas salmonicida TaxID=645 RepID=UPI0039A63AC5